MNCSSCNNLNEEGAKFCNNCGINLYSTPSHKNLNPKLSDILLVIFLSITFFSVVAQFAIQKLVDNWYEGPTKYLQGLLWLLQNFIFILIPLSIKNKSLKIVGLIISIVLIMYWSYVNIDFMIN